MALYTDLPLYVDSLNLLVTFEPYCRKMDRDQRYTNGQRIKQLMTEVIMEVYKANKYQDKLEHILKAQEYVVEVQVLLRILEEVSQLHDKAFCIMAEKTCNVAKQLSAWERALKSKTP